MQEFPFDPRDKEIVGQIRKMPVFDAIDLKLLPPLLKMAKMRRHDAGEVIINEGDTDQLVYFLVRGSVTVNVDGLDVTAISKLGEVFGEMAAFDSQPRSATITAETPTLSLVLNGQFMEHLEGVDKLASRALFYRIFCGILAGRIRDTNTKILAMEEELKNLAVQKANALIAMQQIPFDPKDKDLVRAIMSIPAFKPLAGGKFSDFMKMVTVYDYDQMENVITQGEKDQRMFFLLKGKLSVRVNDVEVSVLNRRNTVFGEMGIIDSSPRSATVMAKRPSRCLALDISSFNKLQGRAKLAVQAFFFKMFYDILVKRLRDTNAHLADLDMQRVVMENMDI